jgi:hypothetical protein
MSLRRFSIAETQKELHLCRRNLAESGPSAFERQDRNPVACSSLLLTGTYRQTSLDQIA